MPKVLLIATVFYALSVVYFSGIESALYFITGLSVGTTLFRAFQKEHGDKE